jgi:sucrose-6-phosphate hydrolase SacC (GH32 family)
MRFPKRYFSLVLAILCSLPCLAQNPAVYQERYRPQFHFSPAQNWMNDPNGLIYFQGEYHLFYQHNPFGDEWGHMSWGHAVSKDLVSWEHLPIALPELKDRMAFSGCVVVDKTNSAGFQKGTEPPLVAIYTGYRQSDGWQAQFLAYSHDRGRTWTDYSQHPVLDISSTDFRDPNVFRFGDEWRMVIALPTERKVAFYRSKDLKRWEHLSDFGPQGAVGGAWECPDLFPLKVADENMTRWVLQVDLDRNGYAGGSGGQYFIGDFDGNEFRLDSPSPRLLFPKGDAVARVFEVNGQGSWKLEPGVCGSTRESVGQAVSEPFILDRSWLNFEIQGGRHPEQLEVRLRVGGRIVKRTTGFNGSMFQPIAWDVSGWKGQEAQIELWDQTTDLWGHLAIRRATLSSRPAPVSKDLARWVDFGPDYYACLSFHNLEGRCVWLAWMNNWLYGQQIPTKPWRSAMSFPREVTLKRLNGALELCQKPVTELAKLRDKTDHFTKNVLADGGASEIPLALGSGELTIRWKPSSGELLKWTLLGLNYELDLEAQELRFQRGIGQVDVHSTFENKTTVPLKLKPESWEIQMLYDQSSIELFTQEGSLSLTARTFPSKSEPTTLVLSADRGSVEISNRSLRSIW